MLGLLVKNNKLKNQFKEKKLQPYTRNKNSARNFTANIAFKPIFKLD